MFDFSYSNILNSNIFNFVLMVIILYKLLKKPISDLLKSKVEITVNNISVSENKKETARKVLEKANLEAATVPEETAKMKHNAEKMLEALNKKYKDDLSGFKETKSKATARRLESEENDMLKKLTGDFISISADKAKSEIIEELNNNPLLHDKIIERIIGEI